MFLLFINKPRVRFKKSLYFASKIYLRYRQLMRTEGYSIYKLMKQLLNKALTDEHEQLLRGMDIKTIIDYFGSIELLDNIDYLVIANYLMFRREDRLYEDEACQEAPQVCKANMSDRAEIKDALAFDE